MWASSTVTRRLANEATMALLRFQVEDTGIGMTEEQLAQIFLPFEQVGAPDLRAKGTGLGLSITRSLVDEMHGTIEVQSTPGEGTIFDVTLTAAGEMVADPTGGHLKSDCGWVRRATAHRAGRG